MIEITQNDFTERTGEDLVEILREDGITNDRLADTKLLRWEKYVYKVASRFNNCINAKLNEAQIEDVKTAVCNYGLQCCLHGDLEVIGGDKLDNATRDIIAVLRQHGIIQNGFKGRSGFFVGRW